MTQPPTHKATQLKEQFFFFQVRHCSSRAVSTIHGFHGVHGHDRDHCVHDGPDPCPCPSSSSQCGVGCAQAPVEVSALKALQGKQPSEEDLAGV